MRHVHLYKRLTHRWAPGWADMDEHQMVTPANLTGWRQTLNPDVYTATATVPAGASRRDARDIVRALIDTLGGSHCTHEYDCCGCAYRHVNARRVSRNRYGVTMRVTFNH